MTHIQQCSTLRTLLAAFIAITAWITSYASNDNIIIQELVDEYTIKEANGEIAQVKNVETVTFLAQRSADRAFAVTGYSDDIKIDKASAPGAKAIYTKDEDDDILFSDAKICVLPVMLEPNKAVKAVFHKTFTKPEQFCTVPLYSSYTVKSGKFVVRVPKSLAERIKVVPDNLPSTLTLTRQETASEVIYTVTGTDIAHYERERLAPHISLCAPHLRVHGQFRDANEIYRYLNSRINLDNASHASVDSLAQRLTAGKASVYEKIDTIASWVRQNIRYIAIENGDYGIYPEKAEVVLQKRFGDCKGSASLIRSLLRSACIDGRFVWVGTRDDIGTDWTDFPALASGNHMIAAAVVNDSIIYIDGTVRYCPAGYIPASLRGAQTLVEKNADECMVGRVPDVDISADTDMLTAELNITDNGVSGHLTRNLRGIMHLMFSQMYYDNKKTSQSSIAKAFLSYPQKASISFSNIDIADVADNSTSGTTITADFTDSGAISRTASTLYVSVYPIKEAFLDVLDLKERVRGVRVSNAVRYVANITINIPDGYTAEAIPMQRSVQTKWFDCNIAYNYAPDGKAVVCTAEFHTKLRTADRSELEAWNAEYKKFMSANQWRLVLQKQQ
jgi:hypothetical protein